MTASDVQNLPNAAARYQDKTKVEASESFFAQEFQPSDGGALNPFVEMLSAAVDSRIFQAHSMLLQAAGSNKQLHLAVS